jgi:hypothetical protein
MKTPKREVEYQLGHVHSHCGPVFHNDKYYCQHFLPRAGRSFGACESVAGEINPKFWCVRFEKKATARSS